MPLHHTLKQELLCTTLHVHCAQPVTDLGLQLKQKGDASHAG